MNRKKLFVLMMALLLTSTYVSAGNVVDINLEAGYVDPTTDKGEYPRAPIYIPHIGLDDYALTFYTPCDGCTLQLLDENGYASFVTAIPVGTSSLILPSYLSGIYQIRIIQGNICFWGYIDL